MSDPKHDVIKQALSDPKFKSELLKDSKSAIERATGLKLPAGMTIKVVEDSASTVHLILPAPREAGERRLSDKELEKASGAGSGTRPVWQPGGNCQSTGCVR